MRSRAFASNLLKPGLVIAVSLLLSLAVLLSARQAGAMPALQATRTATPTRTRTPTPARTATPTPTRTLAPPSLNQQVVFGFGAQINDPCRNRADPSVQSVIYTRAGMLGRFDRLCLLGFPQHEKVQVKIFDPAGQLVLSVPYTIQNPEITLIDRPALSVLNLPPLPFSAPAGQWSVRVERPGSTVRGSFDVGQEVWDYSYGRRVAANSPWYDPRRTSNFSAGETLLVDGISDLKDQAIPLAIYRMGNPITLVTAQNVRTDQDGRFNAGFTLDRQFSPGLYFIKLAPNPDSINLGLSVPKYYFSVIQPEQACRGAQPSRLQKDQTAFVSAGQALDVREKPGLSNRPVGKLNEYEALQVLKGPMCADGMVWWKVSSLNTGMDGWAPEGKSGDYWMVSMGK